MFCNTCDKILSCSAIHLMVSLSDDFNINTCKNYSEDSKYKYKHISEHDELMAAIYDYFTDNLPDYIDNNIAKDKIAETLFNL